MQLLIYVQFWYKLKSNIMKTVRIKPADVGTNFAVAILRLPWQPDCPPSTPGPPPGTPGPGRALHLRCTRKLDLAMSTYCWDVITDWRFDGHKSYFASYCLVYILLENAFSYRETFLGNSRTHYFIFKSLKFRLSSATSEIYLAITCDTLYV